MSSNLIHNVRAVVLWSRRGRDADKIVGMFTDTLGRVTARATSAAGAAARFAALTEPFAESEIALYLAPGRLWGKIVGGRPWRSYPRLRVDMERSTAASWVCEVVARLTPEEQPNLEKYNLLTDTLAALESAPEAGNVRLGFALRFLRIAGFGVDHRDAWLALQARHPERAEALLHAPLATLGESRWDGPDILSLEHLAGQIISEHLARPLFVNRFRQLTGIAI